MVDLTVNEKDKDNFITDVALGVGNGKYLVSYASGRTVEEDFSVHNFNVELRKMERQFYEYKKSYLEKINNIASKALFKKMISTILFFTELYFVTQSDIPMFLKISLGIIFALSCLIQRIKQNFELNQCGLAFKYIEMVEKYLKIKENFRVDVLDPYTGKEEDWYIVNLGNIDSVFNNGKPMLDVLCNENLIKNENNEYTEFLKINVPRKR